MEKKSPYMLYTRTNNLSLSLSLLGLPRRGRGEGGRVTLEGRRPQHYKPQRGWTGRRLDRPEVETDHKTDRAHQPTRDELLIFKLLQNTSQSKVKTMTLIIM